MKETKRGERDGARVVQQQALASAGAADPLRDSPRMVAQRARIDAAFGAVAQKAGAREDEEPLQARMGAAAPQNETGMPNQLKAGIEALSGMDMSDVRVHRNSDKPAQLNALAYAQGNDIHLGPGQEQHLPHEAWHVVQQAQGRVRATTHVAGARVNDDSTLEGEADVMGARAQHMATHEPLNLQRKTTENSSGVVQGFFGESYLLGLAQYFGVESTVASVAAVLGISSGALLAGLAIFSAAGVVYSIPKMMDYFYGDPVEGSVLDEDRGTLKSDIDSLMRKIKSKLESNENEAEEIAKLLKSSGRDWVVYAPFASWKRGMGKLLETWDEKWSIEETAGLLLDIGGSLRSLQTEIQVNTVLMNKYMEGSRTASKKINRNSDWVKDLPENTKVQAGVSATTGNLLLLIRKLDLAKEALEVEALMSGVILYWKNSRLKQVLGQFHTAAEVWAAYEFHVRNYVYSGGEEGHEKVD